MQYKNYEPILYSFATHGSVETICDLSSYYHISVWKDPLLLVLALERNFRIATQSGCL